MECHLIRLYKQDLLLKEAEFLQELEKKFDHSIGGSKDLTDAAAGAYFNAITSDEKATFSSNNNPSLYGGGPNSLAPLSYFDFGILQDYMRRNPRRGRVFRV